MYVQVKAVVQLYMVNKILTLNGGTVIQEWLTACLKNNQENNNLASLYWKHDMDSSCGTAVARGQIQATAWKITDNISILAPFRTQEFIHTLYLMIPVERAQKWVYITRIMMHQIWPPSMGCGVGYDSTYITSTNSRHETLLHCYIVLVNIRQDHHKPQGWQDQYLRAHVGGQVMK